MRVINRILPISIALFSVAIYLYTAAPFMLWEDAPRFLAAIITLGIAWPAEPVYVFLAHWFTYLPFGSVVFRVQFFSALLAGGSLLLLYRLVIRILKIPIPLHLTKKQLKKIRKSSYQHPELSIQRFTLPNEYTIMLAGIFSMSVLAFSYQFWSQAQNVETFILDCFIELVILNLLLSEISNKTVFKILAIVVVICGIATGTDPPVIASVFPMVLYVAWQWRRTLRIRRLAILFLLGVSGIVLAWSYLPLAEMRNPLLNNVNGLTFQGIWVSVVGQNVNNPSIGWSTGFTGSPTIILSSVWHYLVIAWMDFTPFLLPFIILGAAYLWRTKRYTFFLLFLVVATNFIFSCLYLSGNQESWYLQSHIVFAVFAGVGYAWLIETISTRNLKLDLRIAQAGLLILALIPLFYWWQTLDRHRWHFTQEYINNLYKPIQSPAILVGYGSMWDAASSYAYVTHYNHNIVPIPNGALYLNAWIGIDRASRAHIKIPDASHLTYSSAAEYTKFMNDFFAENIDKYHIYLTIPALEASYIPSPLFQSFQIDEKRFNFIPHGMVQEIVPKNKESTFNLNDFVYHFGNGFPQTQPQFLEKTPTFEMQFVINEIARSYDNAANYLMYQGKYDEAGFFYQKAYALAPTEPRILGDIGLFYSKQNQPEKALDYFRKAHAIQPDNVTWLYDIAIAEGQLGNIDEEKKDIKRIIDNPQVDAAYKQALIEQLNSLNQQIGSSEASTQPKIPSLPSGWKQFTNAAMNLKFVYPQTLRLNQMSPQLVSISDSPSSDMEGQLLIYSIVVSDGNLSKIPIPFHISGKLAQQPVQFPGFEALMDVYSDTSGQTLLLLLHKGQQVFVIRFPKQTAFDKEVLNQIVQSIATVN